MQSVPDAAIRERIDIDHAILHIGDRWYVASYGKTDWTPHTTRTDAIRALARIDEAVQAGLRG